MDREPRNGRKLKWSTEKEIWQWREVTKPTGGGEEPTKRENRQVRCTRMSPHMLADRCGAESKRTARRSGYIHVLVVPRQGWFAKCPPFPTNNPNLNFSHLSIKGLVRKRKADYIIIPTKGWNQTIVMHVVDQLLDHQQPIGLNLLFVVVYINGLG